MLNNMNILRILLSTFLLLAVLVGNALAQNESLSATAQYLESQVKEGDYKAIAKAADSGDMTLIPHLKKLASDIKARNNSNSPAFQAHIALAKLGNKEAMQEILNEVDAENPDVQDKAMKKLSYVGGKKAFRKFYQLLDDTSARENPQCKIDIENFNKNHPEGGNCGFCCTVIYFSRSIMAMFFLSKMVDNPPTTKLGDTYLQIWKEWFEKNKSLVD